MDLLQPIYFANKCELRFTNSDSKEIQNSHLQGEFIGKGALKMT